MQEIQTSIHLEYLDELKVSVLIIRLLQTIHSISAIQSSKHSVYDTAIDKESWGIYLPILKSRSRIARTGYTQHKQGHKSKEYNHPKAYSVNTSRTNHQLTVGKTICYTIYLYVKDVIWIDDTSANKWYLQIKTSDNNQI